MVIEMISIDVPGLMMIFATAIMAYLDNLFCDGCCCSDLYPLQISISSESIEPYLRIIALNNVEKYRDYIEYFGLEESNENQTVKPLFFNSLTTETNYVGED